MINLCLPKPNRKKLLQALKRGDISIEKLYKMSDKERNTIFSHYVGKDFSSLVNAKFEQAMMSKQKKAIANWITRTTSRKDPIRRDMLKKVERIKGVLTATDEQGFLNDLADMKLGISVSEKEAGKILVMKNNIDDAKMGWNKINATKELAENPTSKTAGWINEKDRLTYGFALDDFKEYVGKLKMEAITTPWAEKFKPQNWWRDIVDAASVSKSLVATLDNSFIGRQGIKTLYDGKYKLWATTAATSFKHFGKELMTKSPGLFKSRNDAILRAVRADAFSRPNALNGKYNAAKNGYGLSVLKEEVFPTAFPEKIPLLGRVFKASETAFSGSAIRMRADLADVIIANAEKNGIDMLDEIQATSFGKLVTSMTGRGEIGKLAAVGEELNVLLFSVRFLKSNFDTVTAHLFDRTITPEARKLAVKSTLRIAASITGLLATAKMIDPDSVDFDPRSSRFGQICVNNRCFDVTGGMRGFVTLGARIFPTFHNGEWGFWTKSATTGKFTKMGAGYGKQNALDTLENFIEGKASPGVAALRDIWKGEKFGGEKPTFVNTTLGLITPISADTLMDELKKGNDDILIAMMAEIVGISNFKTTFRGTGKKWGQLKEKKGDKIFNEALRNVTEKFNEKAKKLETSSKWGRMDNDEQTKALDKIRREETARALLHYGGIK